MKMGRTIVAALALAAASGTAAAQAPSLKLGFVNTDRVMKESRVAQAAQKALEAEFSRRSKEIASGAPADVERRQRALAEDMNLKREDALKQVVDRANAVIRRIAQQENLDAVFYEAVYAAPRIDLTDKVIKALDASK